MAEGSVARTLRILEVVCERGPQTLKGLSDLTGLSSPTLLRILRQMADEGYVLQLPDRRWRGTMLVWRLGCAVNGTVGVSQTARTHTDRLTAELGETSVYAFHDSGSIIYAARAEPPNPIRAHARLGQSFRLLQVNSGHAVLAYLDRSTIDRIIDQQNDADDDRDRDRIHTMLAQIRERGYSAGPGLRWPELWACAAPIFDVTGYPIGALGVSVPTARSAQVSEAAIAAVVREAAEMSIDLGHRSPD